MIFLTMETCPHLFHMKFIMDIASLFTQILYFCIRKLASKMENCVGASWIAPEHQHFYILLEMFPDICPKYLRKLCLGKDETEDVLNTLISELLTGSYTKIKRKLTKIDCKEAIFKHQMLVNLVPDADPGYLMDQVKMLIHNPYEFNEFVTRLTEEKNYPSKEEYLKKLELLEEEEKYVKKFDINYFFEKIPNPEEYFESRNVSYKENDDYFYALTFLRNKYHYVHFKDIIKSFDNCNCSIVQAAKELEAKSPAANDVKDLNFKINCTNIDLLQEIAYVQNKGDILDYIQLANEQNARIKRLAEEVGFFYSCECCFNDVVNVYEIVSCEKGHMFCSDCVRKSCEIAIGDGKVDFPCLTSCDSQFSLIVLQNVLPPNIFSKMAHRKMLEEVRQAEIDDLAFCPFCDYATILAPEDKIFQCLNEKCLKTTCRLCKKLSHVPLTCAEIERKENEGEKQEENNRKYVEEKMTEALIRKCYKCSKCFLKESGCNKMICGCGAIMCYVCKRPIKGYNHFKEKGGCPLRSDTPLLHREQVRQGAQRAKQDLGNVNLKYDPSKNL